MKRLHQFCLVSVLTFMLTLSAFAGDINCGVVSPPPQQTAVAGDMGTEETATGDKATDENFLIDPVTGLALDVLQSLLTLF